MKEVLRNSIFSGGQRGRLRVRLVAWTAIACVTVVVVLKIALPLFVSTASVRTNMERALSSWTGGKASISGVPEIGFWPHPSLTLQTVTIQAADGSPMVSVDAIRADFDLLAALRGSPVFYDFRLVNPVFTVERRKDGSLNWRRAGWMADAIANSGTQSRGPEGRFPIGDISIENGALELVDRAADTAYRIASISGRIAWPTPADPISVRLSALVKGETIDWGFTTEEPLRFFAGHSAVVKTSLSSALVTARFEGGGTLSGARFFSGSLSLDAPAILPLLRWCGLEGQAAAPDGAVALDAQVTLGDEMLKLDALDLEIAGAEASGVLDMAMLQDQSPRIGGTLAFDRLDLTPLFSILSAQPAAPGQIAGAIDTAFLSQVRLDLRVSAQQAVIGPLALSDMAAGVMVENGRASLDIGDSAYAGGRLSGRMAISEQWINGGGRVDLSLKGVDLGRVAENFGLTGTLPGGSGSVSLGLSTDQPMWATTLADLSGSFRLSANEGALGNFDAAAFERLLANSQSFRLSQIQAGAFSFATADIEASLRRGVATIARMDFTGAQRRLSLQGTAALPGKAISFSGTLSATDETETAIAPLRFAADGSWDDPQFSAMPLAVEQ